MTGPLPAPAQRADSAADSAATEDSLDRLSRRTYSSRHQATLEMWRQRELTRDQVQRAANDPDPEVSGRAKWILRQWRRGSLPDTPPEISRLLNRTDGPIAAERLLEEGQFTAAVVAVEESAGTIEGDSIEKRITTALRRRFPIYVRHAIASESLPDLLHLIDLVADSKEMALCRVQLMQQMGIELDHDRLLPSSAATWSEVDRQRAMVLLLMILGKSDEAIEIARNSVDEELLRKCRMLAAQWPELARETASAARDAEPASYEHAWLWTLAMMAADRAQDATLFAESARELSSVTDSAAPLAGNDPGAELRWKCLAIHGQVDAAFSIVDQTSPDSSASMAIDAARAERAFEVLGYSLERIDSDWQQWVDDAIIRQQENTASELSLEVRGMLALIQCLIAIGRDDAAYQIAERMCESDVNVASLRLREFVLSSLSMTKRSDWVIDLALAEREKTLSATSQSTISRTLTDADAITLEIVMQSLAALFPTETLEQRLSAACQLLDGNLPQRFDPDTDFRRFYEYVTRPRPTRLSRGRGTGGPRILANLNIVRMLARHGEAELAANCLKQLAQTGDLNAVFHLAEQELDGGQAETSRELFETVFRSVSAQGRTGGRLGGNDDVATAVKALIGSWTVARRIGDEQWSGELEREIRLALCSPSTELRSSVASYLGERGDALLAMEAYEILLPLHVFGTVENTGLYDIARSYALLARESNVEEAARWFDLAICGTLASMNYRPGAYVTLPLYVKRWSVEGAIKRGVTDEIARHIDRILELDPLDIDFAENMLPQIREAGMGELADRTLNRMIDRGIQHAASFPFDAMTCNNVAWAAAMNDSRLDEALRLSELAVYVEPESAVYRDTLAEVLFRLGRKEEALQIEKACLLDDPSQWHLHEQVRKYTEALQQDDPQNN